jgi:hypothetical protein
LEALICYNKISEFICRIEGAGKSGKEDATGFKSVNKMLSGHGGGDFAYTGGTEDKGLSACLSVVGGEGAVGLSLNVGKVGKEVLDFFGDGAEDQNWFHDG